MTEISLEDVFPKRRIYFAHPVTDYNTLWEAAALVRLAVHYDLSRCEIINPNAEIHDKAYAKQGMDYFNELVRLCDDFVWAPFEDRTIGAGVFKEYQSYMQSTDEPVVVKLRRDFELELDAHPHRLYVMSVEETRAKIKAIREERA